MMALYWKMNRDPETRFKMPILAVHALPIPAIEAKRRFEKQKRKRVRFWEELLGKSLCGLPYWGKEGDEWDVFETMPGINLFQAIALLEDEARQITMNIVEERPPSKVVTGRMLRRLIKEKFRQDERR